jgi:hypothetical protein
MLDVTDKAERYWASMLRYQELAAEAEFRFSASYITRSQRDTG